MKKIKCLIVDDEPIARKIIRGYCQQLQFVEIAGECENAFEAITLVKAGGIDVIFLDINMPILDGLSFIKSLTNRPQVIFTTAYKDYAIDAFDLDVTDYLVKPFSFERFFKAIQKVVPDGDFGTTAGLTTDTETTDGMFLKMGKTIFRFTFQNILFCEAQQNYTRIVSKDHEVRIYQSLSQIEEQLPPQYFIRSHRSFIVNKNHISRIDGNRIFIGEHEIAIGPQSKDEFLARLGLK
jgi:DNA-binding LytR/AlgR family response regulator